MKKAYAYDDEQEGTTEIYWVCLECCREMEE